MFVLPPLPFAQDHLEPFLDAETIGIHHGKHHQAYVNNLNIALEGTDLLGASLDDIVRVAHTYSAGVRNHGGGVWNHTFYWNCLGAGKDTPSSEMVALLEKQFGSMEAFQEQCNKTAMGVFGSGWAWLVKTASGSLELMQTANQDHPWQTRPDVTPIMVIDVWEHAYYLKYRNLRADYLTNLWRVINWEAVERHWNEGYQHPLAV